MPGHAERRRLPRPVEARPIRVGLIGAGGMGKLRARAIARVPSLRLTAVADARPGAAEAIVGGGVAAETDAATLAANPEIDAIVLSTPPVSHEALAMACLRAGKHVLCEKPLATTAEACARMVEAADGAGVSLATGFNLRHTRAARLARKLLDEGAIGALDHVRAFHGHGGGKEFDPAWVTDSRVTGGGTLMDNGIHLIDLTRWFLGDVVEAKGFASGHTWRKEGCEDNGFLLLRSSRGHVATLHASWTEWRGYGYRIELYGTEGYVRFGYPPLYLEHGVRGTNGRTRVRRHLFPWYQLAERLHGWEWGMVETLTRELASWGVSLEKGLEPAVGGRDGWEAVRIAQAAERA